MKYSIADIDMDLILAAAFPKEAPEEAEFRRVLGRSPDEADRKLGLARVVEVAQALDGITSEVQ